MERSAGAEDWTPAQLPALLAGPHLRGQTEFQSQTFSYKSSAHLVIYRRFAAMYLQNDISTTYYYGYDVP